MSTLPRSDEGKRLRKKVDRIEQAIEIAELQHTVDCRLEQINQLKGQLTDQTERLSDARAHEQQVWVSIRNIVKLPNDSDIRSKLRELYDANNDGY